MRKLIFQMVVSLDGYFEGPAGEIDWHNVDGEFNEYAADLLSSVDILLFGRVTYGIMAAYWPTPAAINDDPIIAEKMNSLNKIVFSRTLPAAAWNNTRLVKVGAAEEVVKLKQQPGRNIAIFGSSGLALTFIEHGLIDEYRIIISPVVLGGGKLLFKGIKGRLNLELVKARTFGSGNQLLYYRQRKQPPEFSI
jgi:dihydrofolate reductase